MIFEKKNHVLNICICNSVRYFATVCHFVASNLEENSFSNTYQLVCELCVVDETEKNRKLDVDNTLEKLKGSLEGIIYKPDIKQVFRFKHAKFLIRALQLSPL